MAIMERHFNEKLAATEQSLDTLQSQYERQKKTLEEQFNQEVAARQSQLVEQIQFEEERKHEAIDKLAADYKMKSDKLKTEFEIFEKGYKEKK